MTDITGDEVRENLCGKSKSFALPVAEVKARLGKPHAIALLHQMVQTNGVAMRYDDVIRILNEHRRELGTPNSLKPRVLRECVRVA